MTIEHVLTLVVTFGALGLFLWNRLRVDVVGIIVMAALIVLRLVTPREGISGFANEALVTVGAMFVLSAGLVRTGAIDLLGRWVARFAGKSEMRLLVLSLVIVIPLSAFINNTPVVVVMIPMVMGLSRRIGASPSRLFMPISFGSQIGGTLTLIGTSTNLLVAGLVLELGLPRLHLFDITPPALIMAAVGVLYLLTVGRWLTPVRETSGDLLSTYELRDYLTILNVLDESPLVGKSLRELRFADRYGLQVIGIERRGRKLSYPRGGVIIQSADLLYVEGKSADIAQIAEADHVEIKGTKPDFPLTMPNGEEPKGSPEEQGKLAEVIIPPQSPIVGRSLRDLNFRGRYGVPVLGIQRHGVALHERLGNVPLEQGDILLVQALPAELQQLHASGHLALLGALEIETKRTAKMGLALTILLAVVLLAAFDVMPIMVSAILGVIAMFLTGCVKPEEAYEEVDWMVLVLLGSIIPLGLAMQKTGTAQLIATQLLRTIEPFGLFGALAAFYLLTSVLTELISNNAAAVVLTPVAIATAASLGASPMPFIIAVMFAASNSFMTPIGYQTNTFIYGPGGYEFGDFLRVGGPLNLLLLVVATLVIPLFFPF
ncbi:MAG TPA: SLC13 family permease [Thermoanaerobaculia bacterium]|nr:SLC13 family permease [Thermoanaerobaculia bacterium]